MQHHRAAGELIEPRPFDRETWERYVETTTGREARAELVAALDVVRASGRALDLGCGPGNGTIELLRRGLSVVGVDSSEVAIAHTAERALAAGLAERLETRLAEFEALALERGSFDLIHAGYSLHFCRPESFDALWSKLVTALRPGGVFSGELFGTRDTWAFDHPESMSFLDPADWPRLTAGLEVLAFEEEERDGPTALGDEKHWHLYHFLLRRT